MAEEEKPVLYPRLRAYQETEAQRVQRVAHEEQVRVQQVTEAALRKRFGADE